MRERDPALGMLSATLDVGMVAGLVLTASLGWPWCFFIVFPFGLGAAALAPTVLEESRDDAAPPPDLPGSRRRGADRRRADGRVRRRIPDRRRSPAPGRFLRRPDPAAAQGHGRPADHSVRMSRMLSRCS
jgi:hypothetical protein